MSQNEREDWTLSNGAFPILYSLIFCLTCLLIVSFPAYINRWNAVAILFPAAYGAWKTADNLSPDDTFNEIYIRFILIGTSHILSMAYQNDGSKNVPNHLDNKDVRAEWSPWYRGYKNVFNIRGVGTPWELSFLWPGIKYTWEASKPADPQFMKEASKIEEEKPTARHNLTTRGRWSGVGIRIVYILINFFLLAAYFEFVEEGQLFKTGPSDYIPEKESILRRLVWSRIGNKTTTTPVTFREMQIRALDFFETTVGDFLLLSLYHDVCAVVFIAIGLDESWEWPPFFGHVTETWTMRRFWNVFWHRTIYRSFNRHASVISGTLGIPQRTQIARYVNAFLVFFLSAAMHSLIQAKHGSRCAWGRTMMYWMLQPVGFLVEGLVQEVWGAMFRTRTRQFVGDGVLNVFERTIGYVWVCAFWLWVAPKRSFPLINCEA